MYIQCTILFQVLNFLRNIRKNDVGNTETWSPFYWDYLSEFLVFHNLTTSDRNIFLKQKGFFTTVFVILGFKEKD